MYLDLSDRVHCEILYTRGVWEENLTGIFEKLIRPKMVVVDLGANVGYYTLLAAEKVGEEGKVFAFEPEPSRFRLLEKNVGVNDCSNVVLVQKAVSDRTGVTRLYLDPRHNKGDHRLYNSFDGRESVAVDTTRLDDFFKDGNYRIDLIKMDIQGAEMAALEGMEKVLKKNDDLVLITEFWPAGMEGFGFSPIKFLTTLVRNGFRLHIPVGDMRSIEEIGPEQIIERCKTEIYLVCMKGGRSFPA